MIVFAYTEVVRRAQKICWATPLLQVNLLHLLRDNLACDPVRRHRGGLRCGGCNSSFETTQ
jgi:hypothetical protein